MPLTTKLTFDMCLKQLFPPLLRGGEVWILPEEIMAEPAALLSALGAADKGRAQLRADRYGRPCSTQSSPAKPRCRAKTWRILLFGGEQLSKELVDALLVRAAASPDLEYLRPDRGDRQRVRCHNWLWRRSDDRSSHRQRADLHFEFLAASGPIGVRVSCTLVVPVWPAAISTGRS